MPTLAPPVASWRPAIERHGGPRYLAFVDELASDLGRGVLRAGDRLPPQRDLAGRLGVNLATITRAIAEAERRGLVRAEPGRGTFIADPSQRVQVGGPTDLTINFPPEPGQFDLGARFAATAARLLRGGGARALLRYPELGGSEHDRMAASAWLRKRGLTIGADHVVLTHGADHGIQLGLTTLASPERRRVVVESLSYPGFRTAAAVLGLEVVSIPCDVEGPDPAALARVARAGPVVCCITPVIHNPTGRTFTARRITELLRVAERHDVRFLEDDVYGFLASNPLQPIAALAPDRALYLTSFSKSFAPGLRIGYLAAASDKWAEQIGTAARSTTLTPAPLTSAVATVWINEGTADAVLDAVRTELRARSTLAGEVLGEVLTAAEPESPHRWLRLPDGWRRGEFVERARRAGVLVRASDPFASGGEPPEAVRISVSAASDTTALRTALMRIARLLREPHGRAHAVV